MKIAIGIYLALGLLRATILVRGLVRYGRAQLERYEARGATFEAAVFKALLSVFVIPAAAADVVAWPVFMAINMWRDWPRARAEIVRIWAEAKAKDEAKAVRR